MNQAYAQFVVAHSTSGVMPARITIMTGLPSLDAPRRIKATQIPRDKALREFDFEANPNERLRHCVWRASFPS